MIPLIFFGPPKEFPLFQVCFPLLTGALRLTVLFLLIKRNTNGKRKISTPSSCCHLGRCTWFVAGGCLSAIPVPAQGNDLPPQFWNTTVTNRRWTSSFIFPKKCELSDRTCSILLFLYNNLGRMFCFIHLPRSRAHGTLIRTGNKFPPVNKCFTALFPSSETNKKVVKRLSPEKMASRESWMEEMERNRRNGSTDTSQTPAARKSNKHSTVTHFIH